MDALLYYISKAKQKLISQIFDFTLKLFLLSGSRF